MVIDNAAVKREMLKGSYRTTQADPRFPNQNQTR